MMTTTINGRRYTLDEGLYEEICNGIRAGYTLEEELEDIRDGWNEEWGSVEDAVATCEDIWDDLVEEYKNN